MTSSAADKKALRQRLVQERLHLADRLARIARLQQVMRMWLMDRSDAVVGAYWPIKGEFDPLPALYRWQEDAVLGSSVRAEDLERHKTQSGLNMLVGSEQQRRIGLPVVNKEHKTLIFYSWYPGCPMETDAYDIPKPKDTAIVVPTLLFVPCVGYGPGGYRLGYGGGFYDRTLATLQPKPFTVGLAYSNALVPDFQPEAHDVPLDAILTDAGVVWGR
jgi:5-formyltetrahydrofolate cyclo-ligase